MYSLLTHTAYTKMEIDSKNESTILAALKSSCIIGVSMLAWETTIIELKLKWGGGGVDDYRPGYIQIA